MIERKFGAAGEEVVIEEFLEGENVVQFILKFVTLTEEIGIPFVGMLFTGIMLTESGPKTLEYNARFGDSETQTLLPLINDKTDLSEIMVVCVEGHLHEVEIVMDNKSCAVVIIASGGCPGPYRQGVEIKMNTAEDYRHETSLQFD